MVTLRRMHPGAGMMKMATVGTIPLEQFTVENVMALYGGGDFEVIGKNAQGQSVDNAQGRFSIDHSIRPKNPNATPDEKQSAPASPQIDIAAVLREARESSRAETSAVVEMAKAAMLRPEPKGETEAILQMVRQMQEDSRKSEERILKVIERMDANRPQPAPQKTFLEQLEESEILIEKLARFRGDGGDKEETVWDKIGRGLAPIAERLADKYFAGDAPAASIVPRAIAPARAAVDASPASSQPATVDAEATPVDPAPTTEPEKDMNLLLGMIKSAALEAAQKTPNAWAWVKEKFQSIPATYHVSLYNLVKQDDWFERVFGQDIAARRAKKFLHELRRSILLHAVVVHATQTAHLVAGDIAAKEIVGFMELPDEIEQTFDDDLLEATDDDEIWSDLFRDFMVVDPTTKKPAPFVFNPAWLAVYRATIQKELAGDDAPAGVAPVVQMEPDAAAVSHTKPAAAKTSSRKRG
jgi:hypothetical protein